VLEIDILFQHTDIASGFTWKVHHHLMFYILWLRHRIAH